MTGFLKTEEDVLLNRAGEEKDILRDQTDRFSQLAERDLPDVHAVDKDRAFGRLEEPRQEMDQRALPSPRLADDAASGVLGNRQRDSPQRRRITLSISEIQIAELNPPADRLEGNTPPISQISRGDARIENLTDTAQRRRASLVLIDHVADRHQRPGEHAEIAVEGDKLSQSHGPLENAAAAQPQHDRRGHTGHHLHQRPKDTPEGCQPQILAHVIGADIREGADPVLFLRVGLHHANPRQILLDVGAELAQLPLDLSRPLEYLAAEDAHGHSDQRQRQQRPQGKPRIDGNHKA